MKKILMALFLFSLLISACGPGQMFGPTFTPTPTNTPTVTPTFTPTSTPTKKPTSTETPTQTPTPEPTLSIPSGTPMSLWNHIPILPDALAAEGRPEDRWYSYTTHTDQDIVLDYYLQQLPLYNWEIEFVSPNDKGGYIIYRKNVLDFIYIFEDGDLTFIEIFLSTGSPSLYP